MAGNQQEMTVAVDFGTNSCAVAYSCDPNEENDVIVVEWGDGIKKVPSAILFKKTEMIKFGNEAVESYKSILSNKKNLGDYHFFQNFKMALYTDGNNEKMAEQQLHKSFYLTDALGKKMRALKVFTESIRYIQKSLYEQLETLSNNIAWVITVPAIWDNEAKNLMRDSAKNAGCSNVIIALEPEAASIYCQSKTSNNTSMETSFTRTLNQNERDGKSTKYMVLDIGGGTLDITVHERKPQNAGIIEIRRVSGTDQGGQQVNKKFETLLETIFSQHKLNKIKNNKPEYWMNIMEKFEHSKRIISEGNEDQGVFCIDLPKNHSLKSLRSIDERGLGIVIEENKLVIPQRVIKNMILEVCENIVKYIRELILPHDLDAILLVGGFSNSKLLQEEIKKAFGRKTTVIVPENCELCVVKGAVLFGWKRDIIRSRKSRYTYLLRLDDILDPSTKLKQKDFLPLVEIDEDIRYDQSKKRTVNHNYSKQRYTTIELYRSACTANKMEKVGNFQLDKSRESRGSEIDLDIFFGDSEIRVQATDRLTGDVKEGRFKFVCQREVAYHDQTSLLY